MELSKLAERLAQIYEQLGLEWEGYGVPNTDDFAVAIAGMQDYLDGLDQEPDDTIRMELPNAGLVVHRLPSGDDVIWVRAGKVQNDTVTQP